MQTPEVPIPDVIGDSSTVVVDAPPARASSGESQARLLDAILNTSDDIIFVIAPDGRYLYVSATAARAIGKPREQIVGLNAEALGVHADLTVWMAKQRAQVLATGKHLTGEFRYPNANGQEREYLYHYSPLTSATGEVEAVICTAHDITEQQRAEAAAAAANARLNAAYQRDHDIAATLQRSLLQMPPPNDFPGLEIVSRYLSATADMEIGGDFIDAFLLDQARVALIVGDVAGKGLDAAARIAESKFTLRGFLREYPSCPVSLTRLNSYLCDTPIWEKQPREGFVCLSVAILDMETGELTASAAGAETPLLARADGRTEILDAQGLPLGVMPDADYPVAITQMEIGDTLLLLTDGITEARSEGGLFGLDGVQQIATGEGAAKPATILADRIMADATAFAGGALGDDAALLLVRRVSQELNPPQSG